MHPKLPWDDVGWSQLGGRAKEGQRHQFQPADQRSKAPRSAVTLIRNRDGALKRCVLPFTRDSIPLVPRPPPRSWVPGASNLCTWGYLSASLEDRLMFHRRIAYYLIIATKLKAFVGRTAAAIEYSVIAAGLSLAIIMVVNCLTDLNAAFSSMLTH